MNILKMRNKKSILAFGSLKYSLSVQPSKVGLRLKGENDLCEVLSISRVTLRKFLNELEEEGIISRQKGSGTYLRKVVDWEKQQGSWKEEFLKSYPAPYPVQKVYEITPGVLAELSRRKIKAEASSLNLVLIDQEEHSKKSSTLRQVYEGILSVSKEERHQVTNYRIREGTEEKRISELILQLRSRQFDGCMIPTRNAELCRILAGIAEVPKVFIHDGFLESPWEPYVGFDMEHAMRKGIQKFHENGISRIALVTPKDKSSSARRRQIYQMEMERWGSSYSRVISIDLSNPAKNPLAEASFWKSGERPEALYLDDDHCVPSVYSALKKFQIVPGKEIFLIAHINNGISLKEASEISCFMFDPFQVGRLAVQNLIESIQNSGTEFVNVMNRMHFIEGKTWKKL